LPSSLANCTQLQLLDLRNNEFTGGLPHYIASFSDLRVLSMGYNSFNGSIPSWITNLHQLQVLDLSNNNFDGKIPSNLKGLHGFKIKPQLSGITLYEDVRIIIKGAEYTLTYVLVTNTIFDLSSNNIIGEIPSSMESLRSLRLLNLSGNHLEGQIPASLSQISTLEQLDLSKNNLSGIIPQDLSKLMELSYLDVSNNKLCGRIPKGTQFDTFNMASFQKNKCLCGNPLPTCTQMGKNKEEGSFSEGLGWLSHVSEHLSLIALGLGIGIGFGGMVSVMTLCNKGIFGKISLNPKRFYGEYRFPT